MLTGARIDHNRGVRRAPSADYAWGVRGIQKGPRRERGEDSGCCLRAHDKEGLHLA